MTKMLPGIARIQELATAYDEAFYTTDSEIIAARKRDLEKALREVGRMLNNPPEKTGRSNRMATREQVLELLNRKMTIPEIASKLKITTSAVKIHKARLIKSGQYHTTNEGLQWPLEFKNEQDAASFVAHQLSEAKQIPEMKSRLAELEDRCNALQSELVNLRNRIKEIVSC